jgi:hypothetical protein
MAQCYPRRHDRAGGEMTTTRLQGRIFALINATAEQRARAALKVLQEAND